MISTGPWALGRYWAEALWCSSQEDQFEYWTMVNGRNKLGHFPARRSRRNAGACYGVGLSGLLTLSNNLDDDAKGLGYYYKAQRNT